MLTPLLNGPLSGNLTIELTSGGIYAVTVTSTSGCTSMVSEPFQVTAVADEIAQAIQVYPNPVSETLTVSLPNAFTASPLTQIVLFDLQGRELIYQPVGRKMVMNLSMQHLPPGVYLLRIQSPEFVLQKKIQKQ